MCFLALNCKPEMSTIPEDKEAKTAISNQDKMQKLLRHIVLFKFKEEASSTSIDSAIQAFTDLPAKIENIRDFEWGVNNSPENLNKGFTHGFLITFHSEEDRSTYLPHPDHKAFGEILGPVLDDVLVFDYWTN